ncbi:MULTISPECIES: hypothetical protein [unclassified Streptomyces]|uniref:hypothetical protein n=1 Tax=unclassified Streptomyces TaxID=2593676 RepID=UPI0004C7E079|nr:hypothetical protein [Streptomyces sp. NRRL F-2747]
MRDQAGHQRAAGTGIATHSSNTKLDSFFSNLKPRSCFVEPAAPEGRMNLSDHRFLVYSVEVVPAA